jgi:hypothetical protein
MPVTEKVVYNFKYIINCNVENILAVFKSFELVKFINMNTMITAHIILVLENAF